MLRNRLIRTACVVGMTLALALPAVAHQAPPAEEAPAAPAADGFQADIVADLERTGAKLVALAEAIPADQFGWRPAEGVRSVSEVLVHVATANEMLPTGMGAAPPEYVELPQTMDMPSVMAWMRERELTTTARTTRSPLCGGRSTTPPRPCRASTPLPWTSRSTSSVCRPLGGPTSSSC